MARCAHRCNVKQTLMGVNIYFLCKPACFTAGHKAMTGELTGSREEPLF